MTGGGEDDETEQRKEIVGGGMVLATDVVEELVARDLKPKLKKNMEEFLWEERVQEVVENG